MEGANITFEDLNPTFLFTCKGTRNGLQENYHSHDYPEISFVLSGEGKYRIDGKIYDVTAGDLLILNPEVWHQALILKECETPATEFFVGCTGVQFPGQPYNYLPIPEDGFIIHTTGEFKQKLYRLCNAMDAENEEHNVGTYCMLKSYVIQMLLLIYREQCEVIPKETSGCAFESVNKKYVVEQISNYFEEHYAEKISLDGIAENMYMSPFYISKIFKSETGDTPIRHLINIRLERAKEFLEQGSDSSIQEIAAAVGYDDAYHFSKLFKKRYGYPPSQVRKMR